MPAPTHDPNDFDPTLRFEAVPYCAEGGFTLPGLFLVFACCVLGGVVTGALAGWIAQWFYLVVFFPLAMAVVVGICGALAVSWGKMRNPLLGIAAGIFGGCMAILAMHFVEFRGFLAEWEERAPGVLALQFSPETFLQFTDQRAVAGVEIVSRPGQKAMNLGYYGSYIYWAVEALIVAGLAAACMAWIAGMPFCSECNTWKVQRDLGRVNVPRNVALQAITSGEIIRLAGKGVGQGPGRLSLSASVCPNCGAASDVDITFKEVTVDSKGEEKQAEIAHVTYPGEALAVLEALFEPSAQPAAATEDETVPVVRRVAAAQGENLIALWPVKPAHEDDIWGLELGEGIATLIDSNDQVAATIARGDGTRVVFPNFWESVKNLGILTDEGKVIWFKPDKAAIKGIKKALKA